MTPQELKNSILQRAIEGKLVEQRAEEGSVDQVILNSSINKIENSESLFNIPKNWEWINLAELCNLIGGYAFKSSKYLSNGVRVIRISDFNEDGLIETDKKFYKEEEILKKYLIKSNDILMCMTGGTVGKTVFLGEIIEKLYLNQRVAAIRVENKSIIDIEYLYCVISSNFIKNIINTQKNSTNDNISMKLIQEFPIPLPPLSEQKRIVEKIEELMPLVEAYEESWKRLEELNKKFPEDMKKSLLQEAIKGKLVEQRPEEGTGEELYETIQAEKKKLIKEGKIKKQKALSEITEDEMPFEIPESWKWVRIGTIFQHNTGKALNRANREGIELEYITTSNLYWDRFELDNLKKMYFKETEFEKCSVMKGDLLVCEGGDIGRAAIWENEYIVMIQNHIHRLRAYHTICTRFFYYLFYLYKNIGLIGGKGIGIKGLSTRALSVIVFPLPPLNEQKRIVERLEELLPLCDQLMTKAE